MVNPRIIFAGAHSGAGKTTVVLGIMLALQKRGLMLQPFKAGPDYIDPTYHTEATGKISRNLDSWLLSRDTVLELFKKHAQNADLSIIEGAMGLYDGRADSEEGSTAQLAKMLKCPVILILDARSLSRSAAAVVLGYKNFDRKVNLSGVILNQITSPRHYGYLKKAIEKRNRIPVLGYLPKNPDLKLPERHLGLVPAPERKLRKVFYRNLSDLVEKNIGLDAVVRISRQAPALPKSKKTLFTSKAVKTSITIAVAKDKAFNFYYPDNLEILENLGAKLVEFSPLSDRELPKKINGIYLGGGFPELFAAQLAKNKNLKKEILARANEGLPIYAECGGLMYLVEKLIDFKKREFSMVGIFKCSVVMGGKLHRMGYVDVQVVKNNILGKQGGRNRAHVFHWSRFAGLPKNTAFAYRVKKNENEVFNDGLIKGRVLASYAHLHFASNINFAKNFIKSCHDKKIK